MTKDKNKMLPNKKIIAFDIDGTLTASKTSITESMANLIKKLIEEKKVIAIAGGSFKQMQTQFLPPIHCIRISDFHWLVIV